MESLPEDDLRFFLDAAHVPALCAGTSAHVIVDVDVLHSRCAVSTVHVRIASAAFFIDDGAVQVQEM